MSHTKPLPELPRPFVPGDEFNPRNYYTADQMREYATAAYDLGARSTAAQPVEPIPDVLFDSFAVLNAMSKQAKARTSPENVCDVLDAVVDLLRAAPPAASGDSTPPSAPVHGDPSGAPRPEPEAAGPDCHGLDTPERVRFYEHDFYVLSNFSAFNVARGGFMFQTAEHLYHYMKFARPWGDEDRGKPIDWSGPEILVAQAIFGAASAHEAFKIAEQNKALRRPDWDQVKVSFMRDILRAKAMQHSYVLRKLLATGDRELVEDSWRDDFWGWGPNRDGKNMLGRLWMEVRAEFRAAEPPQAASVERGD